MTDFVCEVDSLYRSACEELPLYGEHEGKQYCVLHYPGEDKSENFTKVLVSKLKKGDYDFRGTVFPEGTSDFAGHDFDAYTNFNEAIFVGNANFGDAQFSSERTYFRRAQFKGEWADFRAAQFSNEMTIFSEAKFSGEMTDFSGARFSGEMTDFSGARFSGERTDFQEATFSGKRTHFRDAQFSGGWRYFTDVQFSGELTDFSGAQFSGGQTSFMGATFNSEGTDFISAQFSGAGAGFMHAQFSGERTDFSGAWFSGKKTDFSETQFSAAYTTFESVTFSKEVRFSLATFRENVAFWGSKDNLVFAPEAWVWFDTHIAKPELLKFNTVLLHPGWFINADVRKVDFTDVEWYGMPGGPKGTLDEEVKALKARKVESPHYLLTQACRRLSVNAEENRDYLLANEFHYWSLNALRKKGWRSLGLVRTLYWALSGYGVRAARAFGVLVAMWAAFTALYVLVDPSEFKNLGQGIGYIWQAAVYSFLALVRLNPEPRPEDPGVFQFLVGLEGILGPLQIALLALAIRRKVMR